MFEYEVRYPTKKELWVTLGAGLPGFPKQPKHNILTTDFSEGNYGYIAHIYQLVNIIKNKQILGIMTNDITRKIDGEFSRRPRVTSVIIPIDRYLKFGDYGTTIHNLRAS